MNFRLPRALATHWRASEIVPSEWERSTTCSALRPLWIKPNLPLPPQSSPTAGPHTAQPAARLAIPKAAGALRARARACAWGMSPVLPSPTRSGPGETLAAEGRGSGCECGRRSRPTPSQVPSVKWRAPLEANPSLQQLANFHACSRMPLSSQTSPPRVPLEVPCLHLVQIWLQDSGKPPPHLPLLARSLRAPIISGPRTPTLPTLRRPQHIPTPPPTPGPPGGRSPSSPPSCCCRPYP